MGFLYEVACEGCGYRVSVHEGAGMRGVVVVRKCLDCREVVMVFEEFENLRAERLERDGLPPDEIERILDEPFEERCPRCGGAHLESWSDEHNEARNDAGRPLVLDPCPKCVAVMRRTGVVGIWD